MTDKVFENFIRTIYTGGSPMEHFDNLEIIGGVDDISVDTIFGGYNSDKEIDDLHNSVDLEKDISSSKSDIPSNGNVSECLNEDDTIDEPEQIVTTTNIEINFADNSNKIDKHDNVFQIDMAGGSVAEEASFVSNINVSLGGNIPDDDKKNDVNLSTSDIAELLSLYE